MHITMENRKPVLPLTMFDLPTFFTNHNQIWLVLLSFLIESIL